MISFSGQRTKAISPSLLIGKVHQWNAFFSQSSEKHVYKVSGSLRTVTQLDVKQIISSCNYVNEWDLRSGQNNSRNMAASYARTNQNIQFPNRPLKWVGSEWLRQNLVGWYLKTLFIFWPACKFILCIWLSVGLNICTIFNSGTLSSSLSHNKIQNMTASAWRAPTGHGTTLLRSRNSQRPGCFFQSLWHKLQFHIAQILIRFV